VAVIALPQSLQIEGVGPAYSPGDLVQANCSALQSLPAPSLTWYINKVRLRLALGTQVSPLTNEYFSCFVQ
jgi:hypothetical protein